MSARKLHLGLVGTFDVDNYGDLLFPLIAEAELASRLGPVELHCFSYQGKTAAEWPFPVTSVTELPRLAAGLDGLLVGGGFVVRFDKDVAPGYGPPTPAIHHPTGYWLSPALIALQHGVPVLWNAPGAHYEHMPEWTSPLMELALSQSSYISVRDEPSRAALARFVGRDRIEVVPDTVFGLGRLVGDPPSFELSRLRDAAGLTGPYLLIQGVRSLGPCQRFLKRHAGRLRDFRLLALPIGPVNGDDTAVLDADLPGLVRLPVWPGPLLMAELIRQATAVIGPSFHLAITALTAGVPVFSPANLAIGKFPGLAEFETIYPLPAEDDDPDWFLSRLGRAAVLPQVHAAIERLDAHWDRIAEVLRAGRNGTAEKVGRFWQSLPGVLEGMDQRRGAAVAAQEAQTAQARSREEQIRGLEAQIRDLELQSQARETEPPGDPERIAELSRQAEALAAELARRDERIAELDRLLDLARTGIAARDRRIAELLESTSWKVTAPFRFVGRRLGR